MKYLHKNKYWKELLIMAKIRGLKRKFNHALSTYEDALNNHDSYTRLYVPQLTHKDAKVKGFPVSKFLVAHTINAMPNNTHYLYLFDEQYTSNNHVIIANEKEDLVLHLQKADDRKKPEYIQKLEDNYNMIFYPYYATWNMDVEDYSNLEVQEKETILFVKQHDDKITAITNILWLCSGTN